MTEWEEVRLGDLVEIKHGFAFEGQYFRESPPGDVLLTPGNFAIGGGFQDKKTKYYDGPEIEGFVLSPGDLLVTMTDLSKAGDTLGFPAFVPSDGRRYLHNQRLGKVIIREGAPTTKRFVSWVLRTRDYRNEVLASCTGSTVRHTSPKKVCAHRFLLPSCEEQQAIAGLLDLLEEGIELNRRMNETLEAMTRAIFKDWFVDFGPTRAKAEGGEPYLDSEAWAVFPDALDDADGPLGWPIVRLGDQVDLSYGKALPARERREGDVPVYGSGGLTGFHDEALIPGPAIIVGRKGTVGSLYWEDRPSYPIDTVFFVEPKRRPLVYCYYLLDSLPLREMNTDAAVPGLNRENVYRLEVRASPSSVVDAFCAVVGPARELIRRNREQSKTLASLRALLLPKLMSGEIRLKDAEKAVEAVA